MNDDFQFILRDKHVATYGKQQRQVQPLIGVAPHQGQKLFAARKKVDTHVPRNKPWSPEPRSRPLPEKRRKVSHIDLDADDILEVGKESFHNTSRSADDSSCRTIPPTNSARSQKSIESANSISGTTSINTNRSGFRTVDSIVQPRRKRVSRSVPNGSQGVRSNSGYSDASAPIFDEFQRLDDLSDIHGDDRINNAESARKTILENFTQGEGGRVTGSRKQSARQHKYLAVKEFPEMMINESTSESGEKSRYFTSNPTELSKQYVPPPNDLINHTDSEDELAYPNANTNVVTRKRLDIPLKMESNLDNGSRLTTQNKSLRKAPKEQLRGVPLVFARTNNAEECISVSQTNNHDLRLISADSKDLRVVVYDRITGEYNTRFEIKYKDVTKGTLDLTSRIRLEGPRSPAGNSPIFDLNFAESVDYEFFQDSYVAQLPYHYAKPE